MLPAIRVTNLSKRYQIGRRIVSHRTLRDAIVDVLRAPLAQLKSRNEEATTFWALRHVSFEVLPGEVLGIIGRNGAGKSTILKILSQITEPTEGRIELRGRVASLLEVGTGFHSELSGRENIFLNGALLGMARAEIRKKFDEIVGFAEVEKFLDTPVKRYSSGMYVRLAFAVAAHLEPEILIIDEVLAVGDTAFQKKCLGKLDSVAREGRTVLFVSHNMAAVKAMCSQVILLRDGAIVEQGAPSDVVQSYLGAGRVSRAEMKWPDPQCAPGTNVFRLRAARVRNARGEVTSEIRADETFSIEVDYVNLSPGVTLGATVLLFNGEGAHVLSSVSNREPDWHGKSFPGGLFRSKCFVPRHLLPDGHFEVSVVLWANNYTVFHREDSVVEFEVEDSAELRGDYFGPWVGVVRPALDWTTEHLSENQNYTPRDLTTSHGI